jgi:hypothetical protein
MHWVQLSKNIPIDLLGLDHEGNDGDQDKEEGEV